MSKKKYYNLKPLLKTGCNWMILYGMRSNGKSYAVKKHVIEEALEGKTFVYLRRWREDIKAKSVANYFDDMPFNEITGGKWQGIQAYQGYFYFYTIGEDDKPQRAAEPCGRYCALNEAERYKSQVFKDCASIIFEEFITNKLYLGTDTTSESKLLVQFVSTVARDRNINVFMIGNTISRTCPYFSDWGLKGVLKQKPGTIDIYHLRGENGIVDIAVENCEVVKTESKMFFGLVSKQITSGEWEVDEMPKLLKPYEFYDMLYEIGVKAWEFYYIMQLMSDPDNGGVFVYIYPNTKKRKTDRLICPEFHTDPFVSRGLLSDIKAEVMIAQCMRRGKICFSDNLTGTDFTQLLDKIDLKGVI